MIFGTDWHASITMDDYQSKALSTAAIDKDGPLAGMQLGILTLGLSGESAEFLELAMAMAVRSGKFADYMKKVLGHGHDLDREKVVKELGDVLWYVAMIAEMVDIPLSEVAETNNKKLANRYPNGFESEKSINRTE